MLHLQITAVEQLVCTVGRLPCVLCIFVGRVTISIISYTSYEGLRCDRIATTARIRPAKMVAAPTGVEWFLGGITNLLFRISTCRLPGSSRLGRKTS